MNKSFKVVFSKAHSALMVVNEATSSIQAKGTKTVIAVAAAMVAGGAMAAQWVDAPTGVTAVTTTSAWDSVKAQNVFAPTDKLNFLTATDKKTFDKELWVKGSGTSANPMGLLAIGNGAEITNSGKIYITTEGDYWKANAFSAQNGATAINAGTIVAKSGVGMIVSSEAIGGTNTIINAANGQIYVEDNGQGMQLGGAANSKGVNQGLISAGKAAKDKETIGVQIETAGNTFTNEGTISAKDATHALLVKADASNSTINFEKTSKVEGLISVLGTATTINFNGAAGKYTIATTEQTTGTPAGEAKEAAKTGTTLNVKDGADVELVDGKKATYDALNVVNGKISASIWGNDNTFSNVTVEKDGIFNITKLNSRLDGKTVTDSVKGDRLLIARNQSITLKGGKLQAEGADLKAALKIGTSGKGSGALTIAAGDYTFGDVQVYTNGVLNITDGALTVNNLNLAGTNAAATVEAGSLTVNGKLTNEATTTLKVEKDGTLNLSKDSIGLKITAATGEAKADTVETASGFNTLTNNGTVVVSGLSGTTVKAGTLGEIVKKIAGEKTNGQVRLDGLSVDAKDLEGYDSTKNTLTASGAASLNGVQLEQFKNTTVTGVSGASNGLNSSFGAIQLADAAGTDKAAALTIDADKSIYLNNSGNLVTDKDGKLADVALAEGASFVTTGNNAVVGAVTGKSGNFTVQSGSLEVKGNVDVSDLTVNGALAVNEKAAVPASGETAAVQAVKYTVTTNNLTVNQGATLNVLHDLTLNANTTPSNGGVAATAYDADIDGTVNVKGTLSANGRTVNVGSDTTTGSLSVGTLANAVIFADPAWENGQEAARVAVKTLDGQSTVEAGRNSIVAVGTTDITKAQAALAATGFKIGEVTATSTGLVNAAVYVTAEPKVGTDGKVDYSGTTVQGKVLASGAPTQTATADISDGLTVKNGTLAILDATGFDKTGATAVVKGNVAVEDGAKVFVSGLKNGDKLKMSEVTTTVGAKAEVLYTGDMLMNFALAQDGTYQMTMEDRAAVNKALGNVAGLNAAYGMFEEGVDNNSSSAQFNKWLYTSTSSPMNDGTAAGNVEALRKVAGDVAALGATTGVQTMTMDAVNQMGDTVADRVSVLTQRAAGVNVWAAANGGMFEAKSLFDGAGYESDIYSGVLGVDYQFSCNAVLGAALTIGTADTDSKNTGVAASTDSDLVGFSVYTSKTFADMVGVSADIGYLTASNDVTANGYGQAWKFSQDTDAFTIGLRTEVLAEVGAVKFVPHVGIRYTALSTDGFEAGYKTDVDDQNIFQMPVGVTVSGDFQTGDWTVAPKFDLSVVPTFGDKDADLKLGITGVKATDDLSVRVMDSAPVQATLGVNATNGAWGFGLNYKLGLGSDDRTNNTFNVNVRYAF